MILFSKFSDQKFSSIYVTDNYLTVQMDRTKQHTLLHHPIRRKTCNERKKSPCFLQRGRKRGRTYLRSFIKSARKNVHFPRHSSKHPIGWRRVLEAGTACQGVPLSKQKSCRKRRRKRGREKEEEGAWWHVVGPSRSESHAFRQSSVRRGAYIREHLVIPSLPARFVRVPLSNVTPARDKQRPFDSRPSNRPFQTLHIGRKLVK